jgi:tetratricopeptide (TPR) repeat protein
VVFGESAALGDPQPRFGLSRMLQAMLELRHQGTHFEVVNTGIVAINSNVIRPIARDCRSLNADIWVIYMGNNEVVGPFGAGTVFGQQSLPLPLIRANLALKTTRIGQFMDWLRQSIQKPPLDQSEWGGMEMFLNQQVGAYDSRMPAVYDHFAQNLKDMIAAGRGSGASLVVSTVAVNLRDCAPFASAHGPRLGIGDQQRWETLYQKGTAAQAAGQFAAAADWYRQAATIDNDFAELHYRQGDCALALGQTDSAREQFGQARDLDTLRFRCDNRLNQILRETVNQSADSRVVLADAESAFAAHSTGGSPGDDLFYEHVHLTFEGNYLLASTVAQQVEKLLPATVTAHADAEQFWPSIADCAKRLAWTDWDRLEALAEIQARLQDPPFTHQWNHSEELARLRQSLDKLATASQPPGLKAARQACRIALTAAPDDAILQEQLAILDEQAGDLADATTNAERALVLQPASSANASKLGVILAKQHRYQEAVALFRRAFQMDPRDAWDLQNLAQTLNDLGQREEAIREFRHALAVNPRFGLAWLSLGSILDQMGRQPEAEDCYRRAVQNRIKRLPELTTLTQFCERHGWREAAATNYDELIILNPSDATLYVAAGQNLAALGRRAEAEQRYAEAVKLAPNFMNAHFLYGLELGRDGKPTEAADQFREAVRIMPDLVEAHLNLALALEHQGNYVEALAQYHQVLEANPSNAFALSRTLALRQQPKPAP